MIEFTGEFELDRPPEELWPYFTDPDVLADCAPGVQEMTLVSDSEVEAVLSVKVGSVRPTFDASATVARADAPISLRMAGSGDASRSAVEGAAGMDLRATEDGTLAEWRATAEVSGLLASLGQRALGSVTERLVNSFFDCLQEKAEAGAPATARLAAAEDVDFEAPGDVLEEGE